MTHAWTDEKRNQMRDMIMAGRSLTQVGAAFGVTRDGVAYQVEKMGLRSRFSASRWTDESVTQLTALFHQGLSASAIAEEMETTRNSIIGKLNRMGLTNLLRPVRPAAPRKEKLAALREPVCVKQAKRLPELAAADVVPLHLSLIELERGQCRYPYGDDKITFCGCKAAPSSPYCEAHHELTHLQARVA